MNDKLVSNLSKLLAIKFYPEQYFKFWENFIINFYLKQTIFIILITLIDQHMEKTGITLTFSHITDAGYVRSKFNY